MAAAANGLSAAPAVAQGAPPTSADAPSIRVGATIFADYTYTVAPEALDTDGNVIQPNAFNVARSYINVTGTISRLVAFRITPDVVRETGSGSSLNGSLTFRLKYVYAQLNLDDWLARGSWARFGMQQTAFVGFEEDVYRYRFQGTVFVDREGFLSSSDTGASFRYNMPSNYGEVHVALYNGETYTKTETNDQKALQVRVTVRPFAASGPLPQGLRLTGFHQADHYVQAAERTRTIGGATFEHRLLNVGFHHVWARDQRSVELPFTQASGYSFWATPRTTKGWEGLVRYDRLTPNTDLDGQARTRTIVGVAYWLVRAGNATTAVLLDYEGVNANKLVPAQPRQRRIALHALVNF